MRQNLRFQGQYLDREAGLHYNLFRYYDPAGGRYTQPDPPGLVGGLNTCAYVGDPLTWVDPLGLNGCVPVSSRTRSNVKDDEKKILYHYTHNNGLDGILTSKKLNPSLKANNPKNARYGDGQYLSDVKHGTKKGWPAIVCLFKYSLSG
ncbi:hypothetical protein BG55_17225 [Erwinia mallotivora]|uniref:Tox-ART-HYD1 domain-containing protein n=1 Tax=Erwinia mallotivora TaxID=69222 RepID=A0A014PU43_9GAMM|nr:RHS repeat-associated core domain-containing protein [Erwinia mallotivora]EXU74362.1 hypothetical protein BG55_17225 [Erwinia mallotivora]